LEDLFFGRGRGHVALILYWQAGVLTTKRKFHLEFLPKIGNSLPKRVAAGERAMLLAFVSLQLAPKPSAGVIPSLVRRADGDL
jgi:hypothetical protein